MARITDGSTVFEVKKVLDGTASKAQEIDLDMTYSKNQLITISRYKERLVSMLNSVAGGSQKKFAVAGNLEKIINNWNNLEDTINGDSHIVIATRTHPNIANGRLDLYYWGSGKVYTVFCQNGVLGDVLEQTFSKATLSAPTTEKLTKADSSVVADKSLELKPYYIEVKGKTIQYFKDTLLSLVTSHQSAGKIVVQISTDMPVLLANWDNPNRLFSGGGIITIEVGSIHTAGYAHCRFYGYNAEEYIFTIQNQIVSGIIKIASKSMDNNMTAKTQATTDSSDNVATTQFVKNAIAAALAEKGL